jgi:hypothetical protein
MWHCVGLLLTDISEEHVSIFRVEEIMHAMKHIRQLGGTEWEPLEEKVKPTVSAWWKVCGEEFDREVWKSLGPGWNLRNTMRQYTAIHRL